MLGYYFYANRQGVTFWSSTTPLKMNSCLETTSPDFFSSSLPHWHISPHVFYTLLHTLFMMLFQIIPITLVPLSPFWLICTLQVMWIHVKCIVYCVVENYLQKVIHLDTINIVRNSPASVCTSSCLWLYEAIISLLVTGMPWEKGPSYRTCRVLSWKVSSIENASNTLFTKSYFLATAITARFLWYSFNIVRYLRSVEYFRGIKYVAGWV